MTSPTHPTTPASAVTLAVMSVAAAITTKRVRPASIPRARASSSPSDSTLIRQRSRISGTSPMSTIGSAGRMSGVVMDANDPSSQKVIAGSWS